MFQKIYPTFARTKPPATFASKSLTSALKHFNWTQVALLYSEVKLFNYKDIVEAVKISFQNNGIKVLQERSWSDLFVYGFQLEEITMYQKWVRELKDKARIFVVIGEKDVHLAILEAMVKENALENGCFVIGITLDEYHYNGKKMKSGVKNRKKNQMCCIHR